MPAPPPTPQQTITREFRFQGIALHEGGVVSVRLAPLAEDAGIVFRRAGTDAEIRADCAAVADTHLATTLRRGDVVVGTVEHLLSAAAALAVDNLLVETDAAELPILDGSAAPWFIALAACGIQAQKAPRRYMRVKKEVRVADGGRHAAWRPAADGACRYDVRIRYPHEVVNRSGMHCRFALAADDYGRRISRARTFCYINDVEMMHRARRALGGSLNNAVVYDDRGVINREGLRYPDEFVRHKVLDAVGDCYINGHLVIGDYAAAGPGHDINNRLMRALQADAAAWEWTETPPA